MKPIFLNADLGENESALRTRSMMRVIDLANIACGGHTGSIASMRFAVVEALKNGVKIGAHPGLPDRAGFGRSTEPVSSELLECIIVSQISALATIARSIGAKLHHVKLHGALYHAVESSPVLAATYLQTVEQFFPRLGVIARLGGEVEKFSDVFGLRIFREAFVDRAYDDFGNLIPRNQPDALIRTRAAVVAQARRLVTDGISGLGRPDTLCVHGDTPGALQIAHAVSTVLSHR